MTNTTYVTDILGDGMKAIPHTMRFKVVLMTPKVASEMLKYIHPKQRKRKEARIALYAADMRAEFWELTHEAVAFDIDGWLIDGRNRLEAVVKSNVCVPMLIITGVPRRAMIVVDSGMSRNVVDAARVASVDLPHGANQFAAVAKQMMVGIKNYGRALSHQEVLDFITAQRKAIEFTFEVMPKSKALFDPGRSAGCHGPSLLPAPVHHTRTRIAEFAEVFLSGLVNNPKKDSAAIRLRNWLISNLSMQRGDRARPRADTIYLKSATALNHFLAHKELESLKETVSEELFPLPGFTDLDDPIEEET